MRNFGVAVVAVIAVVFISTGAVAKVKIPYFDKVSETDLCGGVPKDCQPNSSKLWAKITDPVDYNDVPATFIGRKYSNIYTRDDCTPQPDPAADIEVFGISEIQGSVVAATKPGLTAKINADVTKIANDLGASLPNNLKAKLEAQLGSEVSNALNQAVTIKYQRIQMSDQFKKNNLKACLESTPKSQKVITGISVVSVTAEWTKTRVKNALDVFEADIGFSGLSIAAKASFGEDKTMVLSGKYPTTAFVIRVAYDKGLAQ